MTKPKKHNHSKADPHEHAQEAPGLYVTKAGRLVFLFSATSSKATPAHRKG
jgi:hypothetical protein